MHWKNTQDHENNQVVQKLEQQLATVIDIIKNIKLKQISVLHMSLGGLLGQMFYQKTDE